MDIRSFVAREAQEINRMFQANRIWARVDPSRSLYLNPAAGFIRYGLDVPPEQLWNGVEKIQRELSNALTKIRLSVGLSSVKVLPVTTPLFGLEVPHPDPQVLQWTPRLINVTGPHSMFLGRSATPAGEQNEYNSFVTGSPHVLVAGITGAGKSILLQNMLLSLCHATSPDDLRLVIVDLKNEDMLPFEHLPHVLKFAHTRPEALDAIRFVSQEKDKRIKQRDYRPYRLVLWIDEMAQLAESKEARVLLGDLASIGRSKDINLVGATQHPTEAGGLGTMLKANFPLRLVGMVAHGQSHIATGLPQLHADLLPGKGSFLRIEGDKVQRFQTHLLDESRVNYGVKLIDQKWGGGYRGGYGVDIQPDMGMDTRVDIHAYTSENTEKASSSSIAGYTFPIRVGRPLQENEVTLLRQMIDAGQFNGEGNKVSLRKLSFFVYGSRDPKRTQWLKDAL